MARERFDFDNPRGERLAGLIERPAGDVRGWAVFAHCFTCGKDIAAASRIARALVAEGFGVLRFDFTGLGNSEGEFENTSFSSNVEDLVAAANALGDVQLLIGHSLGGAAVVAAAGALESVKAVVTIGAPSHPTHVKALFACDLDTIEADGAAEVQLAGRNFTIAKHFVDDLEVHPMAEHLQNLKKALLIMHSPIDELVSIDEASKIYRAARHPKSFVSLDDADHLLSRPRDSRYAAKTIAAWASRYLPEATEKKTYKNLPAGTTRVQTESGKFTQHVTMGHHHLTADEPTDVGGDDRGPNPYDLLLGALGSCVAMTLQMYAARKQWPLEAVSVDLKHERLHAKDCEECEQTDGRVERITRELKLEGPLDDEQRQRILEIADKCPVHRTLTGDTTIVTKLA